MSPHKIPPSKNADFSPAAVAGHFNAAAATWDENLQRRELTQAIAAAIATAVPLLPHWRVLEYGCGTANLSFLLASRVHAIVAADASPGMVEQIHRKLEASPALNIQPRLLDLTREPAPAERFDLILAAMTLHHIPDVPDLLSRLAGMLGDAGWLAIADLHAEDGSFHSELAVPHHGFAPDTMVQNINQALATHSCHWRVVHHLPKNGRMYPVCLWTAQKTGPGTPP